MVESSEVVRVAKQNETSAPSNSSTPSGWKRLRCPYCKRVQLVLADVSAEEFLKLERLDADCPGPTVKEFRPLTDRLTWSKGSDFYEPTVKQKQQQKGGGR